MNAARKIRRKSEQSGIALLLAIFVLLLVCVVGLAMMSASGTETSLSGNYRSSTSAYYAALSGLEEGRGRLLPKNPHYLSGVIPPYGTLLPLGTAIYILNPLGGETVAPTNLGNPATYPDTEWATEFPNFNPATSVQTVASQPTILSPSGTPNAFYKWVRINALTEWALQLDVNQSGGAINQVQPIYFDGSNLTRTATQFQAFGVTALAALPDGSRKLLQYVVAPVSLNLPINAALTLAGPDDTAINTVTFAVPPSYTFRINGNDQAPGTNPTITCAVKPPFPAVGVFGNYDYSYLHDTDLLPHAANYTGAGSTSPNVSPSPYVHPSNASVDMTNANSLTNLVQSLQGSADTVLTGSVTNSDLPFGTSLANPNYPNDPLTIVVNGDMTLSSYTGYGLLVVTGKLTYTGDAGWKGIVLVIGQGVVEETGSADGGEFLGAVFVAKTVGGTLGPASYTIASPGGRGINYNSCWIAAVQKPTTYKVLSFHEIPYP